jgi:hypothetical protein
VPLRSPKRPGKSHNNDDGWDPFDLPTRTEDDLRRHLERIRTARTTAERKALATHYGINGKTLLLRIPSLSFEHSFPYEFMHLIFENVCPMLVKHWTGTGIFKNCEPADAGYWLAPRVWEQIGKETAEAYKTLPTDFVGAMPDISKSKYKAEYWSFWMQHVGPILLRNRFPNDKFYKHYCDLVTIIKLCLQFTITDQELEDLQQRIVNWVEKYEKYQLLY